MATHSDRDASPDYQRHSVDLSAYAGRTVTLAFAVTSKAAATDFALDDITQGGIGPQSSSPSAARLSRSSMMARRRASRWVRRIWASW